jgi:hypothetical protein
LATLLIAAIFALLLAGLVWIVLRLSGSSKRGKEP